MLEGTSMTWVDTLALRKDEKVVDSWQGIREVVGGTFEGTLEEERTKKSNGFDFFCLRVFWTRLIGGQCFLLLVFEMTTYMFVREEEEEDCEDCDCEDCEDEE